MLVELGVKTDVQAPNTWRLKSLIPAATSSLFKLLMKARVGIDSSCSSGYSRVSIARKTGCCSSSLRKGLHRASAKFDC